MGMMSIEEYRAFINKANTRTHTHNKPRQLEHDIQVQCVEWFGRTFPEYEPFFWATPNGGFRAKKTAILMKQEGMKAGVPDLQLAYPMHGYHGLFIEMKKSSIGKKGQLIGKGKTSEAQEVRMAALERAGYKCAVCYSFDEFRKTIQGYLSVRCSELQNK